MFCTFIIMLAIELSLLVNKPGARVFAGTVVAVGLLMHALARMMQKRAPLSSGKELEKTHRLRPEYLEGTASRPRIICAVRRRGGTLDFAIKVAKEMNQPLYILFVREQPTLNLQDFKREWMDDREARAIFEHAIEKGSGHPILPCYAVSDSAAATIVEIAATMGASHLILGAPRGNILVNFIRGNLLRRVSSALPENIQFIVYHH